MLANRTRGMSHQTRAILGLFINRPHGTQLYGFQIGQLTQLRTGTVYPILGRLERAGWLVSSWEPMLGVGRPPRRLYTLTPAGRAVAMAMAE